MGPRGRLIRHQCRIEHSAPLAPEFVTTTAPSTAIEQWKFGGFGDMPLVPHGMAARLAEAIGPAHAALPRFAGRPGHPVLLSPAAMADAVAHLHGDEGMGRLLRGRADVVFVESDDAGVCADVDLPDDLARLGGD